jgi:hypothetical protein
MTEYRVDGNAPAILQSISYASRAATFNLRPDFAGRAMWTRRRCHADSLEHVEENAALTALPAADGHTPAAAMPWNAAAVSLAQQLYGVQSVAPQRQRPVDDPPLARALEREARSTAWTVGHGRPLYFAPMASRRLDSGIDNLYQLPLAEFTAARNALAKEAGAEGAEIRGLQKPPVAAWAINQLFWRDRDSYDRLIEAAAEVRTAHGAVLAGRKGDLRTPGRLHEDAIQQALTATVEILTKSGQPVTDATRQAIATTLRALPSSDPPGRLTRTLQPGGFEMLTGVPVRAKPPERPRPAAPARKASAGAGEKAPQVDTKALARAKDAVAAATRAFREAEHAARRDEFEAARAAREAEKAERVLANARTELETARRAVEEAERDATAAVKARETAAKRSRASDAALDTARSRVETAQGELNKF